MFFKKLFIFIIFSLSGIFADENSFQEIDLTKLEWFVTQESRLNNYEPEIKVKKFPILLNKLFPEIKSEEVRIFKIRTKFLLNKADKKMNLALFFPGIGEAWEISLNGTVLKNEFHVYDEEKIIIYKYTRNLILYLPEHLLLDENLLEIKVAGYSPATPLSSNFLFGLPFGSGYKISTEDALAKEHKQNLQTALNAVYIFFGIYHIFFFIRRPKEKYNLYFGLFSFAIALYIAGFSNIAFDYVENTSYLLLITYSSQPLALILFSFFIHSYIEPEIRISRQIYYGTFLNSVIIIGIMLTGVRFYQSFLILWYIFAGLQIVYILYFIIRSAILKRKDARSLVGSVLIVTIFVIWDILDTLYFNTQVRLVQYSHFFIIISLVFILANRFLEIHLETERLNIELTKQKEAFFRFVPVQFLDALGKRSAVDILAGENYQSIMSVLFSDIRSFTKISEDMGSEATFKLLNSYLKRMEFIIQKNGGFVDKYVGDAIMALFTENESNSADLALKAAIGMRNRLEIINKFRGQKGLKPMEAGIGINTGELILGTIGSNRRLDTTVIGDTVNLASRIEGLCSFYKAFILISENTYKSLINKNFIRNIDLVQVKGRNEPIEIYEAYSFLSEDKLKKREKNSQFLIEGIELYRKGEFKLALECFENGLSIDSEDDIINLYCIRSRAILAGLKPEKWDGVSRF